LIKVVHETIMFVCANKCEEIYANESNRRAGVAT
jgi:hypothetical protein